MRGYDFGTFSASAASAAGKIFGLSPYVSCVMYPFEPTNTAPPPSPLGRGTSARIIGESPPSYQYIVTAGLSPRAANSYRVVMASGYDAGLLAGPPQGVEFDTVDVGRPRPNDQYDWSMRCAPMSPMALTPNGTHPLQLNG